MAQRKQLSGLDLASQQISNLADGTAATDAVTLQQMQSFLRGLDWKASVRAASTANVTIASALTNGSTMDGVTLATGDRVLLKNQTTGSENGIYTVVASGAASRTADATTGTLSSNAAVFVEEGTTLADTQWVLTTNAPLTVGTTSLTWAQFGGGNVYTAGTNGGLQLSSNAFSVLLPGSSGLTEDGTGLHIDKAIVMTRFAADIGDGSTTAVVVTHSLGTRDVTVRLYDKSTNAEVDVDVVHTSTSAVTLNFATAPTTNQYRVIVIG
jgi:hypothetical protein